MANFEALIRGALTAQDDKNHQVRAKIYQSSRNALHRMITQNRSFTVETAISQQQELEDAIARIEAEYRVVEPAPAPATPIPETQVPHSAAPQAPQNVGASVEPVETSVQNPQADDPLAELKGIIAGDTQQQEAMAHNAAAHQESDPTNVAIEPVQPEFAETPAQPNIIHNEGEIALQQPAMEATIDPEFDSYPSERKPPLGFEKRRKSQKRFLWFLIILLLLLLLGLLGYRLVFSFMEGSLFGNSSRNQNILSQQNNAEGFITILEAADTSALIVANRGTAEIVTQQNSQLIRIVSTRSQQALSQTARPILLRFPPGVVEQISEKQITLEILAKSGTSLPAQFAVECQFGTAGGCSRKRFRIGVQPEASVFAANVGKINDVNQAIYLAINTDTTNSAAVTGKGDEVDIAYIRLRVNE